MSESTVVAGLGWRGWLRFIWRQLTSMRVALMLLMLLAVAAIPGSIIPQRMANPTGYQRYLQDHPDRVDLLNRLQLFDVYTSVWFSAIYLLLFISLIGCIIPRIRVHARALRQAPPRAPRNFERMPVHVASASVSVDVDEASARALRFLRRPRFTGRFRTAISNQEGAIVVGGESGYLRETGNLLFHVALVGILISVALGQLFHYRGQVILVQGKGFANAQVDYDTFESGAWFDPASMSSFNMTLDDFDAQFRTSDAQAQDFTAHVTITRDGAPAQKQIKVNHPLNIDGAKIYLQGNGYAPEVSVTDADGNVAFAGAIPFISRDSVYTSQGTIKVPDVTSGEQFGLVGYLLPTADQTESGAWRSLFPELLDPALVLTVWRGDLGLDDGIPQNVYQLDTASMTQSLDGANPVTLVVRPGQTVDLPDGLGQFTFEGVKRFVALDLRHDPSLTYVLVSALAAVAGLGLSLFIPRRRMWVRITADSIEAAGISRTDDGGLERAVRSLAEAAAPLAPDSADPKQPKNSNLEGQ